LNALERVRVLLLLPPYLLPVLPMAAVADKRPA